MSSMSFQTLNTGILIIDIILAYQLNVSSLTHPSQALQSLNLKSLILYSGSHLNFPLDFLISLFFLNKNLFSNHQYF